MQQSRFNRSALQLVLFLVLLFMLAPILIVVVNSFNASAVNAWPPPGFTLDWYAKVLANPAFQRGTANSLLVGLVSTAIVLALGTLLAYLPRATVETTSARAYMRLLDREEEPA